MKIQAHHDSSEWFLIEIIGYILQYLKDEFQKHLQRCEPGVDGNRLKATDFEWVITVPAIWQPRGKGMMREAGNMVRNLQDLSTSVNQWPGYLAWHVIQAFLL